MWWFVGVGAFTQNLLCCVQPAQWLARRTCSTEFSADGSHGLLLSRFEREFWKQYYPLGLSALVVHHNNIAKLGGVLFASQLTTCHFTVTSGNGEVISKLPSKILTTTSLSSH
jgi:hypothetical protein